MKAILISLSLCTLLNSSTKAQFGKFKEKFKQQVESLVEKNEETVEEKRIKLYEEQQVKQLIKDTTYYNFSFAQAEKVSYFTSRDDNQGALLAVAKYYDDVDFIKPDLEGHQKAFDFNRSGSNTIGINRVLSLYNFTQALKIYFDHAMADSLLLSFGNMNLKSVLSSLKSDTLTKNDYYAVGKSMSNIAMVYQISGLYSISKELNLALLEFVNDNIGSHSLLEASIFNNLGLIELSLGDYHIAEDYMNKSSGILLERKNELKLDLAVLYNNQAMLYQQTGQYEKAISKVDEALTVAKDKINNNATDYSKLKLNKALILKAQKKYVEAESLLLELKKTKENRFGKGHQDYADIQSILASLYMEMDRNDLVEPFLLNALDIYKKKFSEEHATHTSTLQTLGQYYLINSQYDKSREVLEKAKILIESGFGINHPNFLSVNEQLAVLAWNEGNTQQAATAFIEVCQAKLDQIEKFFPSMSENEKSKFWAKSQSTFLKFYAFVSENYAQDSRLLTEMYNIQLATKGILLNTTSKVRQLILNSANSLLKADYASWINTKEQLANAYGLSKQQIIEQKINIDSLEQRSNHLEKELGKNSSEFANANNLRSTVVEEVISKLSQNEVAIEIIRFQQFKKSFSLEAQYVYLIANSAGQINLFIKQNGNDLETKFASRYRKSIQYQIDDENSYREYWSFLNESLTGKNKVYLSVDGIYNQININTFKLPDGSYLGDGLNIMSLSSTRDIVHASRTIQKAKKIIMFGNPDYGGNGKIEALPGTKQELEKISKLAGAKGINVKTFLSNEASEAKFKSESTNSEVLHIATHGFFLNDVEKDEGVVFGVEIGQAKENPLLRSGLLLAGAENTIDDVESKEVNSSDNGILTAYEVMNMDMSKTKLVILSACETGLGEIRSGEGVYGLQRAFQLAGAETIIMSLWKVNDEATQQLMISFYNEWTKTGDKYNSFKLAQKNLRKQYEQPYYWGAFIIMN